MGPRQYHERGGCGVQASRVFRIAKDTTRFMRWNMQVGPRVDDVHLIFTPHMTSPNLTWGLVICGGATSPEGIVGVGVFLEGLPLGFLGEGRAPTPKNWQALLTGTPVDTALYSVACTGCVTYTEPSDSGNSVRHDFGGELPRPANFITVDVILFVFHLPFLCPVYQRTNDLLTFSCICQSSVLLSPMADFLRLPRRQSTIKRLTRHDSSACMALLSLLVV